MSGINDRRNKLAFQLVRTEGSRYHDAMKSKSVPQGALTTSQATKQREFARAAARARAATYRSRP